MRKSKAESAGDELYTSYDTVDKILRTHISDGKLKGKRILCPCDPILPIKQQPTKVYEDGVHFVQGNKFIGEQQFVRWIDKHAVELGIKSLTCCGLGDERFGTRFGEDVDTANISIGEENSGLFDGSIKDRCDMFRTSASPDYDVIITNPPFSLGTKFVKHLLEHNKDFILVLPWMFYCSEAFYDNLDRVRLGAVVDKPAIFAGKNLEVNDKAVNVVHKGNEQSITITIFTTFDLAERHLVHIKQTKSYAGNEADYPFALNTKEPVIIVNRTQNIPYDYMGLMCVPITFLDNYNPDEFELVGFVGSDNVDENKCNELTNLYNTGIALLKKRILVNPKDKEAQYLLKNSINKNIPYAPNKTIRIGKISRIHYEDNDGNILDRTGFIIRNKGIKTKYEEEKAEQIKHVNPLYGNKIYFYTSPLVPDCICIGQTKGDVEKRIKQEFKNTPEKPYKILHSDLAQKANGEWFSDKDFHKFLNANGYANEIGNHSKNNEWFRIDIKNALKLFKEYKKK